ncbi:MAG: WecB/TagA/CpsF family glycosyltransferase [Deltaproteobacteria bacterium]|nr:WecB/TagA/CpsF family glycosyltransferase [Deltaproteobacteria bacterium]
MPSDTHDLIYRDRTMLNSHYDVIGSRISNENLQSSLQRLRANLDAKTGGYVCFANVHVVTMARCNKELRQAINNAFMALPDGKPVALASRIEGLKAVTRVAGPDFLPFALSSLPNTRNFFYGSTEITLNRLISKVRNDFPAIRIAGHYSPPFRASTEEENDNIIEEIRKTESDIIWVGLGAPKQELWMARNHQKLYPAVLLGVGAAFDFYAGTVQRAPLWVHRIGFEWLYRLHQEPRRLWKRYIVTNSQFMLLLAAKVMFGSRKKNKFN